MHILLSTLGLVPGMQGMKGGVADRVIAMGEILTLKGGIWTKEEEKEGGHYKSSFPYLVGTHSITKISSSVVTKAHAAVGTHP